MVCHGVQRYRSTKKRIKLILKFKSGIKLILKFKFVNDALV